MSSNSNLAAPGSAFDANAANELMDRYSRQIIAMGVDTMKSMGTLRVLVYGQGGVGVEAAKDLILQGPKAVCVYDNAIVTRADLGTNFYLTENNVGKDKRSCVYTQLQELNPFVEVTTTEEFSLDSKFIGSFGAIIVTVPLPLSLLSNINDACRANKVTFVNAVTLGCAASFFSDFGAEHVVTDLDGLPKKEFVIQSFSVDQVQVTAEVHELDDGDQIIFQDIEGPLSILNEKKGIKVKRMYLKNAAGRSQLVKNKFQVDASSIGLNLHDYEWKDGGGIFSVVKPSKVFKGRPIKESFPNPIINDMEYAVKHMNQGQWIDGRGNQVHLALYAVYTYFDRNKELPALHCKKAADECVKIANELNAALGANGVVIEKIDESVVKKMALYARAELTGFCAFLGGVAAQEVLKRFGKWTPVNQWLHVDMFELNGAEVPFDATPLNSRYDHQISIFGQAFQNAINNQKWFLVGCGALGCEYIKSFALMGIGAGSNGKVYITDMDRIEVSNLSRQFLFRSHHVGKPKSVSAADVSKHMNPNMRLECFEQKVCDETENIFTADFWDGLFGVWNALDNVMARKYTDAKCLLHSKPLLESGTQGTSANSEIILPFKTASYADQPEQETGGIAACTLRNFPNTIVHCIEWAKPKFQELFEMQPNTFNTLLSNPKKFWDQYDNQGSDKAKFEFLNEMRLLFDAPRNWQGALALAWHTFHAHYRDNILDLTHFFPQEARNTEPKTGADLGPFWTGAKRFPSAANFDPANEEHIAYMWNCTNLYGFMFGLKPETDRAGFPQFLATAKMEAPKWNKPLSGPSDITEKKDEKDDDGDGEMKQSDSSSEEELAAKVTQLEDFFKAKLGDCMKGVKEMVCNEFEKDDDSNFHIDFITASSNLRACNYRIKPATRLHVKGVAGKIIPALATTTAMIAGLVCMEYYKLTAGLQYTNKACFYNANINLSTAEFNLFEPDNAKVPKVELSVDFQYVNKPYPPVFSSWNHLEVREGDLTVKEFIDLFPRKFHGVRVQNLFKADHSADGALFVDRQDVKPNQALMMLKNPKLSDNVRAMFQKQVDDADRKNAERQALLNRNLKEYYEELYGPLIPGKTFLLLDGAYYVPKGDETIPEAVQKTIDAKIKAKEMDPETDVTVSAICPKIKYYWK